jgi:hypothetical protein
LITLPVPIVALEELRAAIGIGLLDLWAGGESKGREGKVRPSPFQHSRKKSNSSANARRHNPAIVAGGEAATTTPNYYFPFPALS